MSGEHYFSPRPQTPHRPRQWTATLRGQLFTFMSDSGVFSATRVDNGSRLLIETVELPSRGEVLDLGCGYGVLGIVCAASAPRLHVVMVDVNERAIKLAYENAKANGVANTEILASDGFVALGERRFDLIVTNPPFRQGKELVGAWLQQARNHLRPAGRLAMVVRTQQGARSWQRRLSEWYGTCNELGKKGGYRVYEVAVP